MTPTERQPGLGVGWKILAGSAILQLLGWGLCGISRSERMGDVGIFVIRVSVYGLALGLAVVFVQWILSVIRRRKSPGSAE